MLPVLRADDVAAADAAAVAAGTRIETLMERAGWHVARVARQLLSGAYGKHVVVAVGPGNNGGDGLVAARILRSWGASVRVVASTTTFTGAAKWAQERWSGSVEDLSVLDASLLRADLIIDALFGAGLSRDLENEAAKAVAAINDSRIAVLAVDMPSGVDTNTGQVRGIAVKAAATVTFVATKPGLLFEPGRSLAGDVFVADIGIGPAESTGGLAASVDSGLADAFGTERAVDGIMTMQAGDVARAWPTRSGDNHKRNSGTALIVAGSSDMPGAAIMTGSAAVRAGAGLTHLIAPASVVPSIVASVPEMTATGLQDEDPTYEVALSRKADALAIGPGLGREEDTLAAVADLLKAFEGPAIVDADALHALDGVTREAPTIITPHAGEWAAITGRSADEVSKDRLAAASEIFEMLALRLKNLVVVLKGPGTIICDAQRVLVDAEGGPWLAQGGTGDALTGILAAGVAAHARAGSSVALVEVVAAGVWLQGRAGRLAAANSPAGTTPFAGGVSPAGPRLSAATSPAGTTRLIEKIPDAIDAAMRSQ